MASPLRVRKILNSSWAIKQDLLTCGSQRSSCLNGWIVSWILHNPFKNIYILSHVRLQHFPDGNYSNGLPAIAVWKSLWSLNSQSAGRAEEQSQLAGPGVMSPLGPQSMLWEVLFCTVVLWTVHTSVREANLFAVGLWAQGNRQTWKKLYLLVNLNKINIA